MAAVLFSFQAAPINGETTDSNLFELVLIPEGQFEMGDHQGYQDPKHGSDEVPVHTVHLDPFYIQTTEVTNRHYCEFLNSALSRNIVEVKNGKVYGKGNDVLYCETRVSVPYSGIGWDGKQFSVLDNRKDHPMVGMLWEGAAAYCNWLSSRQELEPCYNTNTWKCDFTKNGFRLPTEAEWEYAGRGGKHEPYYMFPWGNDPDNSRANWPRSGDPYETGPYPWTTPVGFYDGNLHHKKDFNWPGRQETYQTKDGSNGYGLYDMAGNVWEWCNDLYFRPYYSMSPSRNPQGPESGSPMPDGKPYHVLRGGNWYNGEYGHSRVANRDPAYYRGPKDPDHEYYHVGFRVVRDFPDDGPRIETGFKENVEMPSERPRGEGRKRPGKGDRGERPERNDRRRPGR